MPSTRNSCPPARTPYTALLYSVSGGFRCLLSLAIGIPNKSSSRYTYHSGTSTLINTCSPTPVHDAFQSFFLRAEKSFSRANALEDDEQPWELVSPEIGGFTGDAAGSRKQADMCIMPTSDDESVPNDGFPLVATEVGFSESYANLLRDMTLWLVGSEGKVRAVILICINETPKYVSKPLLDSEGAPSPPVIPGEKFGPRLVDGHTLVGSITAVLEIWRYNAKSCSAEREVTMNVIPPDPAHTHFNLTMLDFYGWADRVPARFKPEDMIPFDLEGYRKKIAESIPRLGLQRLQRIENEKRKRSLKKDEDEWVPGRDAKRARR